MRKKLKMVREELKKGDLQKIIHALKENWLSVVLGGVGLVLILLGVGMIVKEEKGRPSPEIVVEEKKEERIVVDIEGGVLKPGVYTLSFGSRLQDLLIAAGGLSQEADREWVAKNLNRAKKLVDGEKFYIPKKDKGKVAGVNLPAKININTASLATLETLPGIGKVRAQRIIDGRPYARLEELLEKEVIPASVFAKIKDKISVW